MTIAPVDSSTARLRFPDGSMIEMRPLRPTDGDDIAAFSRQLSPSSEFRRFLTAGGNVRREWVRRLIQADQTEFLAEGAFAINSFGTTLVAIAESVRPGPDAEIAEFALIAADQWQALGVGSQLARHLAERAKASGVRFWEAFMLSENGAMATVMYRVGPRVYGSAASGVTIAIHELS
jgi:acetyltransferase